MNLSKGILVAIEGIDGAGKTTQINLLKTYFEQLGLIVSVFKEPTTGKYGRIIRQLAISGRHVVTPERELDIFILDRIDNCKNNIKPALDRHELVIMDRYYFSNIAYQGALGIDRNIILRKNENVAIIPDLVVILDVAVKVGLSRIRINRNEKPNHFEEECYLEKVRKIYREMEAPYIQLIDSSEDINTLFRHLKNVLESIILPFADIITKNANISNSFNEKGKLKFNLQ